MEINKKDSIRILSILKNIPLIGPRTVNIHITNICNLNCIFCWDRSPLVSIREKDNYLEFSRLKDVISECADIGVNTICLEGGEVFLYPEIKNLIYHIKSEKLFLEVYSNCAYGKSIRKYLGSIDKIKVNLSATNAELYRIIHGSLRKDMFEKVLGNLFFLSKINKIYGKPQTELIYVINELNYKNIEEIIKIGEKLNINNIKFKLIEATQETKQLLFTNNSIKHFKFILKNLKNRKFKVKNNIKDIFKVVFSKDFMNECYSIKRSRKHNDRFFYYWAYDDKYIRCYVSWFYGFIDLKGRVIAPCDNVGVIILGNIYKDPFKKIWFSVKFKKLRDEAKYIDTTTTRWQECRYCGFVNFNKEIHQIILNNTSKFIN